MKKILLIIAIVTLVFAGCSTAPAVEIIPADAAEIILSEVTFRDSLVEAKGDVAKEWYSLDDKVTDFAIYISGSGATAEEIAVIKSSDLKSAQATAEKRIEDLKFRYEDYVPTEMIKLNDPVIVTKGGVVILVLADDSANAQRVVDNLFK